jgi:hypothetical protein
MVSSTAESFSWERTPGPESGSPLATADTSSKRQSVTPSLPGATDIASSPCQASPSRTALPLTAASPWTTKIIRACAGSSTGPAPPLSVSS